MIAFTALLNNTFTVYRRTRISDDQGGWIITYGEIGSVPGRIRPATSGERTVANSEEQQITHVLYTVADVDIARGDMVTCDDLTVEVMGVREPSQAGKHWEIDCLERQNELTEELGS